MAIQMRRGKYELLDPSKLMPGEWAVVLESDPNGTGGRSLYMCFSPGVVKRIATVEDMATIIANENAAITDAEKKRVAAENSRVSAESARETKQASNNSAQTSNNNAQSSNNSAQSSNNTAQAKNNADQAQNNAAAKACASATDAAKAATTAANESKNSADEAAADARKAADEARGSVNVLKGKAKDTIVHVDDAFPSSLLGIDIEGASEQWTSTGKNLAKLTEAQKTSNGVHIDIKANGQIILDGTCSANGMWVSIGTVDVVEGKTYCLSLNKAYQTFGVSAYSVSENRHVIFASAKLQAAKGTAPKTETLKIFAVGGQNTTFTNEVVSIQVEEGSSATSWEPYTDGKPSPSPEYPQDIRVIENPVVKVTGADTSAVSTSIPITLPAEHPYLAKLPDGTADEIRVDRDGNVELVAKVGKSTAAVSDGVGGEVGTDAMSSTDAIAEGAVVYYKLATPVTYALGEVTVPSLPDSTSNVWTDAEVTPKTGIEYTRDVNIVVANLESAIASITQG